MTNKTKCEREQDVDDWFLSTMQIAAERADDRRAMCHRALRLDAAFDALQAAVDRLHRDFPFATDHE